MDEQSSERTASLLEALKRPASADRARAVRALSKIEPSEAAIVRALERAAASDPSKTVREAAQEALSRPVLQTLQRGFSHASPALRRSILAEVGEWEKDGLVPVQLASLLRGRYAVGPSAVPQPPKQPRPARSVSLGQALLSEAAVKIALYLGAFFVLAAAFILAAVVEVARVPILGSLTLLFFVASRWLSARLRMASLVMFGIGTIMIPIDAGVLSDLLGLHGPQLDTYWVIAAAFIGTVCALGTWLHRSRFFSLLAYLSYQVSIVFLGRRVDADPDLYSLLIAAGALAGVSGAWLLRRSQRVGFQSLVFLAAELQIAGSLVVSGFWLLLSVALNELPVAGGTWLQIAATWAVGTAAFVLGETLADDFPVGNVKSLFSFFRPLVVIALIPVPLLALQAASPNTHQFTAAAWIWGLLLMGCSEGLGLREGGGRWKPYAPFLGLASPALFALAALTEWGKSDQLAIGYLGGASLVYLVLMQVKPRQLIWTAALGYAVLAYLAAFSLTGLRRLDLEPAIVYLIPVAVLAGVELVARRVLRAARVWWTSARILALILGCLDALVALANGGRAPGSAAVAFLSFGVIFAIYLGVERSSAFVFGTTSSLAVSLLFARLHFDLDPWVPAFVALAGAYYLVGLAFGYVRRAKPWSAAFLLSALFLGLLTAFSAPVQGGPSAVIGVTILAMLLTLEAFRTRSLWLGFPANMLYFLAYLMVLVDLEVTEPQFYSVAAALLGILMHYLLQRGGQQHPAFVTGVLSQLVLLSTTYVQMISSEQFSFFFLLFFQSLVLLAYGVVIRSRSFVIMPVVFSILGVLGVAFSVLSGLPTALIIGCTGLILLALGVLALLLRERLLEAADSLGGRLGGWKA